MKGSAQASRANSFLALHRAPGAFVMPNPWDAGSARILEGLGFKALASTSVGMAFALGYQDGSLGRDAVLDHCRSLVDAVDVPISADLEQGFGDAPAVVAETIRLAAGTGLAGGSIEDYSGTEIYDIELAADRIAAAVEAGNSLAQPFVLTARAENLIRGVPDLDDTIRRLERYSECGADVLYAPGLADLEAVRTVCRALDKPVNVLVFGSLVQHPVAEFAAAGASRITVGGLLARRALTSLWTAAEETANSGTFDWAATPHAGQIVDDVMRSAP